jgi:hypothetical protein
VNVKKRMKRGVIDWKNDDGKNEGTREELYTRKAAMAIESRETRVPR